MIPLTHVIALSGILFLLGALGALTRRNLIAIGLMVWSAMTALSGAAQTYLHLALARIGVGVGEAAGSPPAHSLISDYFTAEKRATAIRCRRDPTTGSRSSRRSMFLRPVSWR